MTAVRILERVVLPAPLGLVFWDAATASPVRDDLEVTVTDPARPGPGRALYVNSSGVWFTHHLPGLPAHRLTTIETRPDEPVEGLPDAQLSALQRPMRLEVRDRAGRFLPLAFEARLPVRGLYHWPDWGDLPQSPLAPLSDRQSPPVVSPFRIPLFSAPARRVPAPLAEIRAELFDSATGAPAAWALLGVEIDGEVRGLGLADTAGRATVFMPYPERPRPTLGASPPAVSEIAWSATLRVWWDPAAGGSPPAEVPAVPDLAVLMRQLDHPATPLESTLSPPQPLSAQVLAQGRPLIARTIETADGSSSRLFVSPA